MAQQENEIAPGVTMVVEQSTHRTLDVTVEVLSIDGRSVTIRAVGQERTLRKGDVLTITVDPRRL